MMEHIAISGLLTLGEQASIFRRRSNKTLQEMADISGIKRDTVRAIEMDQYDAYNISDLIALYSSYRCYLHVQAVDEGHAKAWDKMREGFTVDIEAVPPKDV